MENSNQSVAVVEQSAVLPVAASVFSKKGKITGLRQHFTANLGAKEIKLALVKKNPFLKGGELKKAINAVLSGEVDIRQQLGVAWLTGAFQAGYTPDVAELRANTGSLKLRKIVAEAPVVAKTLDEQVSAMTPAEKEALLAQLLAK